MIDEGESKRIVVSVSLEKIRPRDEPLENEVRFRNFFERSADAMSLVDPQTLRYVEVSEAAVRLLTGRLFATFRRQNVGRSVSRTVGSRSRRPGKWYS